MEAQQDLGLAIVLEADGASDLLHFLKCFWEVVRRCHNVREERTGEEGESDCSSAGLFTGSR